MNEETLRPLASVCPGAEVVEEGAKVCDAGGDVGAVAAREFRRDLERRGLFLHHLELAAQEERLAQLHAVLAPGVVAAVLAENRHQPQIQVLKQPRVVVVAVVHLLKILCLLNLVQRDHIVPLFARGRIGICTVPIHAP